MQILFFMNAKIIEIFRSIQGEGKYVGVPQVFVRFFECNLHCSWCDTPHSIGDTTRHYQEIALEDLLSKVKAEATDCHSISLTGGEPMLQKDFLRAFLPRLRQEGFKTYLDTNGIYFKELKEIIADVDVIAMDIKLPSSAKCPPFWSEHREFLKVALQKDVFIKVVISRETTIEDVLTAVRLVAAAAADTLFILQPNYFEMKEGLVERCVALQKECLHYLPNVRILPQVHKFLKLR